jgi:hypothetical protein
MQLPATLQSPHSSLQQLLPAGLEAICRALLTVDHIRRPLPPLLLLMLLQLPLR